MAVAPAPCFDPDWRLVFRLELGLTPYALKGLVNHKQPNSDVTGGYLKLTPERLREPAQQVEDRLLQLAKVRRGRSRRTQVPDTGGGEV
jgi:hypothetical protein